MGWEERGVVLGLGGDSELGGSERLRRIVNWGVESRGTSERLRRIVNCGSGSAFGGEVPGGGEPLYGPCLTWGPPRWARDPKFPNTACACSGSASLGVRVAPQICRLMAMTPAICTTDLPSDGNEPNRSALLGL